MVRVKDSVTEAGFEDKPKGWTDKSVDKYEKTFTSKMKGTAKSPKFFDKCVKKMQGKVKNPEGFCAALKDEAFGGDQASSYWRGKGKTQKKLVKMLNNIKTFKVNTYEDKRARSYI